MKKLMFFIALIFGFSTQSYGLFNLSVTWSGDGHPPIRGGSLTLFVKNDTDYDVDLDPSFFRLEDYTPYLKAGVYTLKPSKKYADLSVNHGKPRFSCIKVEVLRDCSSVEMWGGDLIKILGGEPQAAEEAHYPIDPDSKFIKIEENETLWGRFVVEDGDDQYQADFKGDDYFYQNQSGVICVKKGRYTLLHSDEEGKSITVEVLTDCPYQEVGNKGNAQILKASDVQGTSKVTFQTMKINIKKLRMLYFSRSGVTYKAVLPLSCFDGNCLKVGSYKVACLDYEGNCWGLVSLEFLRDALISAMTEANVKILKPDSSEWTSERLAGLKGAGHGEMSQFLEYVENLSKRKEEADSLLNALFE